MQSDDGRENRAAESKCLPVLVFDEVDGVARGGNEEDLHQRVVDGDVGTSEEVKVSGEKDDGIEELRLERDAFTGIVRASFGNWDKGASRKHAVPVNGWPYSPLALRVVVILCKRMKMDARCDKSPGAFTSSGPQLLGSALSGKTDQTTGKCS
jgi:hypothetical protein